VTREDCYELRFHPGRNTTGEAVLNGRFPRWADAERVKKVNEAGLSEQDRNRGYHYSIKPPERRPALGKRNARTCTFSGRRRG
jgi:hypothetical protein